MANLLRKLPKCMGTFWTILEHNTFRVKVTMANFWATFRKFGLLFIYSSGHTGWHSLKNVGVHALKIFDTFVFSF